MKTVSLELSKQLKEAGYPQETEFCYYRNADEYHFLRNPFEGKMRPFPEKTYASPTADEILEQLPEYVMVHRENSGWYCEFKTVSGRKTDIGFFGDTIADAAAKMWLYLKKEKLI